LTITRYGADVVIVISIAAALILAAVWVLTSSRWIQVPVTVLVLAFEALTLNFFRDPERVTPGDPRAVVAPADGTVVVVREVREEEFVAGDAVQVSIFMSPLNVHVNRFPISGTVGLVRHVPGRFLVAFEEKSSENNERTHIGIEDGGFRLLFKQIAGFVARRIIAEVQPGDRAVAGERFGMIRFGSRVDVFMPRGVDVRVRVGETTRAGETVLALRP
jgi:phosphatidylserine decarboxylase